MVDTPQMEVVRQSIDAISKIAIAALSGEEVVEGKASVAVEMPKPEPQKLEIAPSSTETGSSSSADDDSPSISEEDIADHGTTGGDAESAEVKSDAAVNSLDKETSERVDYIYLNTSPSLIQQGLGRIMLIVKLNGKRMRNYLDCHDDELELRRRARICAKNASLTASGAVRVVISDGRDRKHVKVVWKGWAKGGELISDTSKRKEKLEKISP